MLRTMTTATNTMGQLQQQLDIIGNNLANSSTHGYKSTGASFQELLYQQFDNDKADNAPRQSPQGIRYGSGAMIGQTKMNWKMGAMQVTGRELDFTLTTPKQYFNVLMPEGDQEQMNYTRQGAFYVSPVEGGQAMLVTSDGYPVADADGLPITFSDNVKNYTVGPNGTLQIAFNDGTVDNVALGVTVIERPDLMQHITGTYIGLPENMEDLGITPAEVLTNLQGAGRNVIGLENNALEGSNVDYQKEMSDLITVQRSYQFNARSVTLADQMLGLINGLR